MHVSQNTGQVTCWGVGRTRAGPLPEKLLCTKNNQNQAPDQAGNGREGVGKGGHRAPQGDTCAVLLPLSQSCCSSGESNLTPGAPSVPGWWGVCGPRNGGRVLQLVVPEGLVQVLTWFGAFAGSSSPQGHLLGDLKRQHLPQVQPYI